MRAISAILVSLLISCGTVTSRDPIGIGDWISHDHKTDYFVRETSDDSMYLTIKYGSYTFLDKSAETVPVAKSVFRQLAEDLSKKRGYRYAIFAPEAFYESVAYDGVTGISKVLVSNDVRFSNTPETPRSLPSSDGTGGVLGRLETLEKAYKAGLITQKEYEQKRQELLKAF